MKRSDFTVADLAIKYNKLRVKHNEESDIIVGCYAKVIATQSQIDFHALNHLISPGDIVRVIGLCPNEKYCIIRYSIYRGGYIYKSLLERLD